MAFQNQSIKNKTLLLVSGAMFLFALTVGGLFVYNERNYLQTLQKNDERFSNFIYQQIFERQKQKDLATLEAFIQTPGFSEAFAHRDRTKVLQLWNSRWNGIKDEFNILQLHDADGRSFIRMHEQSHFGDKIAINRPMIAYVHKTHRPTSGFEIGIYGLACRVAVPVIINGKYEGALEIGSDPKRLIEEIHNATGISGLLLVPDDPLLKSGMYQKRLGRYWQHAVTNMEPRLYIQLENAQIQGDTTSTHDWLYRYTVSSIPLYDYRHNQVAKAVFIRDNTVQAYTVYFKLFLYGTASFSLVAVLLYFISRWIGILIGRVEDSNHLLSKAVREIDRYKSVLDLHNIVSKSDVNGKITYVNDNFCHISGYSREELLGRSHSIIRHPDTPDALFAEMWNRIKNKKSWSGILKNRKKDGTAYYIDALIVPFMDENGDVSEYMAVRHDITELVKSREDIERIATTDMLTGLGNRFSLITDLGLAKDPSLALLDVDHFSEINDFYGQRIGDKVILELSHLLKDVTKGEVKLYRLGADVFGLLADQMDRQNFLSLSHKIAADIRSKPLMILHKPIPLETTIGISFESANKLLSSCDMALTIGKKQKVPFIIYADELSLEKEYSNNISWALKIKQAIEEDRIITHYQPIINNKTRKIEKYETLVRIIDEEGKVISPSLFLNIAKKSKQYHEITKRVVKRSFDRFANETAGFSINVTIEDILSDDFNTYFQHMIHHYDVKGRLVIELVESEGIENFDQVIAFTTKAKECGCAIAIDDFGTGYSNFEYLLRLQPDFIKIDGSMIRNINSDKSTLEVVKTIVDFAKRTGIQTIAEYVCDEDVFRTVNHLGIDYSQGYYFGEPINSLLPNDDQ